jgi:hypothetical protein
MTENPMLHQPLTFTTVKEMKGSTGKSRQRIVETLNAGTIADKGGRATAILLEKSGYTGSLTGLSSLLNAMEQSGTIRRELRGKRCFAISLANPPLSVVPTHVETPPPAPASPAPVLDTSTDVAALAQALLDRVIEVAGTPQRQHAETERLKAEFAQMQARLYEATERAEKQRQKVRLLEDELAARKVENDGLRLRLRETERNLDAIIKSPNGVRLDVGRERELRDLIRLMKTPPGCAKAS